MVMLVWGRRRSPTYDLDPFPGQSGLTVHHQQQAQPPFLNIFFTKTTSPTAVGVPHTSVSHYCNDVHPLSFQQTFLIFTYIL